MYVHCTLDIPMVDHIKTTTSSFHDKSISNKVLSEENNMICFFLFTCLLLNGVSKISIMCVLSGKQARVNQLEGSSRAR